MTFSKPLNALLTLLVGSSLLVVGGSGCRATKGAEGSTPDEKRSVIQFEMHKTLGELYAAKPEAKEKVAKSAGYGYFSNVNVNLLVLSTENGYGVVHDNASGKDTYMKMAGAGVGLGMGAKDYRAIMVFTDQKVMEDFVTKGWSAGGSADAAAKSKEDGSAAGAAVSAAPGMEIYQFTKAGLALQATVQGTKFWPDDSLNGK
jgi:lipid-binding SYLF domain-containing protein